MIGTIYEGHKEVLFIEEIYVALHFAVSGITSKRLHLNGIGISHFKEQLL